MAIRAHVSPITSHLRNRFKSQDESRALDQVNLGNDELLSRYLYTVIIYSFHLGCLFITILVCVALVVVGGLHTTARYWESAPSSSSFFFFCCCYYYIHQHHVGYCVYKRNGESSPPFILPKREENWTWLSIVCLVKYERITRKEKKKKSSNVLILYTDVECPRFWLECWTGRVLTIHNESSSSSLATAYF